jgi:hypothetical protein
VATLRKLARAGAARVRQRNAAMAFRNRLAVGVGRPRRLLPHPYIDRSNPSSRRLNRLIDHLPGGARYLEIGVYKGRTLESVMSADRVGVDPDPRFRTERLPSGVTFHRLPSDDFFADLADSDRFDLVFVDGLHEFEQTYRDIINAFAHLNDRGAVLVDDVVPSDAFSALRDQDAAVAARARSGASGTLWHGDVFIALEVLIAHHPQIAVRTIVGSGNEQALLWRAGSEPLQAISEAQLREFADITYEQTFSEGVPQHFRPRTEDDAIQDWLTTR